MSIPSMSGRLNMGQIVWSDGCFLRKTQVQPTDTLVGVVGEGHHDHYYMRYEVKAVAQIDFARMDAMIEDNQQCLLLVDSKSRAVLSVYEDGAVVQHAADTIAQMGEWKCDIVGGMQHWTFVPAFGRDWRTHLVRPHSLPLTGGLPAWAAVQLDKAGIIDLKRLRRRLEDLIRKSTHALQAALAAQIGATL